MELYGIFKEGMVFQQKKTIRVFGTSETGSKIDAAICKGNKKLSKGSTVTDKSGHFLVEMPELEAGGPYKLTVSSGKNSKIVIRDVYIGELWFACGQDNMLMPLYMTETPEDARKYVKGEERFHYYEVPLAYAMDEAQAEAERNAKWITVDTDNAPEISAVCYYYALMLLRKLDCHVGIIGCFAMSSSVTSWQSIESVSSTKEGLDYIKDWELSLIELGVQDFDAELNYYHYKLDKWTQAYKKAFAEQPNEGYDTIRKLVGNWPAPVPKGKESGLRPGGLFEPMLLRVLPMNVAGIIFYQGEADTYARCDEYKAVFKSLINEWRTLWGDMNLPFIFCQLHMYIDRNRKFMGYEDYKWPVLREMQHQVSKEVPNTYMAILSDNGEFDNMYPVDKKAPGIRMALLALKSVYGYEEVCAISPYMIDIRCTNGGAEMYFNGDFNMLMMKGFGDTGFEVSGKDGVFYPCDASVDFDGRTVTAFSPYVQEPVAVRYAYFSFGQSSLTSDTGLAVLPFTRNVSKNLEDK